jgi:CRISPR/Cas system-associated endoribonuclease Cas2
MKKLLNKKDILLLTLSGIGDVFEEARDPLSIVSRSYENMYGFIPKEYKRHNFFSLMHKSLKTGHVERVIKNNKQYLRLTSSGKTYIEREFPITSLTKKWNNKWVMVIFDVEEKTRKKRNQLRDMLKNIGFGMLQQSVWITPLSIGQDIKEMLSNQGYSENSFVLEISDVLLGNPRALAAKVWGLDVLEDKYLSLKEEEKVLIERIDHAKSIDGRRKKWRRGDKVSVNGNSVNGNNESIGKLKENLRQKRGEILEFLVTLPPLPKELYPLGFGKAAI